MLNSPSDLWVIACGHGHVWVLVPQTQKFLGVRLRQSPGIEIVEEGGSIAEIHPPSSTTQSRELSRQPNPQEFLSLGTSWVENGFLDVVDSSNKGRKYRLSKKYKEMINSIKKEF